MSILKKTKWIYLVLSVVSVIFGGVLLLYPAQTSDAICKLVGLTALVFGAVEVLKYFIKGETSFAKVISMITGAFCGVCGIILLINPSFVRTFFPFVMGIYIVLDSAFKLLTSFELRDSNTKRWWTVFFLSLAGIILGFFIVFRAKEIGDFLMRIIGVALIVDGIQNLFAVVMASKSGDGTLSASYREINVEEIDPETKQIDEKNE